VLRVPGERSLALRVPMGAQRKNAAPPAAGGRRRSVVSTTAKGYMRLRPFFLPFFAFFLFFAMAHLT